MSDKKTGEILAKLHFKPTRFNSNALQKLVKIKDVVEITGLQTRKAVFTSSPGETEIPGEEIFYLRMNCHVTITIQ